MMIRTFIFLIFIISGNLKANELIISGAKIFDVKSGTWLTGENLSVEKGKIASPLSQLKKPKKIELKNLYIIPGLIDVHTHIFLNDPTNGKDFSQGLFNHVSGQSNEKKIALAKNRLASLLRVGITTIRDLGNDGGLHLVTEAGPKIYSSGKGYVPGSGQLPKGTSAEVILKEYELMNEKSFHEFFKSDKKILKLYADEEPNSSYASPSVLKSWIQKAHEKGVKVAVHAIYRDAIQAAIDAGADSIEHGTDATESQLRQMAEKGIIWVPTTGDSVFLTSKLVSLTSSALPKEMEKLCQTIKNGKKAGVKIAFGSDYYYSLETYGLSFGHGTIESLLYLNQCGLTPADILVAATRQGAHLLGEKDLGSLHPGAHANFVVYEQDPLQNLAILRNPKMVFKDGVQIH